ncbi:tetratricopeptide domain protein [Stanieria cyanosphaera PCC 7437]|uniref:Tetratricopeptide domain protein n=1 Tax=Stanieria cyanosphaera (strain ATCC 29371 / PCC 7437) TaxID=111780 RepID=K9XPY5_STAC7|nr:tetratricopeptide repeat protein [Stanieria cyanosphaera]AFZ33742.1 tetratricopeptide domain protein [Stanieria cyanosphaera PCC 7437]
MSESEINSLSNRYFDLIDRIVDLTLQGKIRSKTQVYRMLHEGIERGTGEIFERCLASRIETTTAQLEKKLKAARILRALETIEGEWQRWQAENQSNQVIVSAQTQITASESDRYLLALIDAIDPNQNQALTRNQLQQLAKALKSTADNQNNHQLAQLAIGIIDGLKSFADLEGDLVSWIYEAGKSYIGFEPEPNNPWRFWAKKVNSPLPRQLFATLGQNHPLTEFVQFASRAELRAWVELVILLHYLERGLVNWFDQQPYNAKFGKQLSYSTFLSFAIIWGELSSLFSASSYQLSDGCFQLMLQTLRTFAVRDDFPLYSGVFISFSGENLQNTLQYFDEPLKQVSGTGEKARILTLLGYSQRTLGRYAKANEFHQEAVVIARETKDRICEIANFNHLSRICVHQQDYETAINYSQRALILARQVGDRLGEANALVNLGYSKVFSARQLDSLDTEVYQEAIRYLEQGLNLAEKLGDVFSQAFGYNSLGIAYVILSQPATAIPSLEKGVQLAQVAQNIYLQGLSFVYLAEAYYQLTNLSQTVYSSCLGMYLLKQIEAIEWRQPAGLLTILKGQVGEEGFQNLLQQVRSLIIPVIGVDGYDYLPTLLQEYQ